jgi:hypothetical protein
MTRRSSTNTSNTTELPAIGHIRGPPSNITCNKLLVAIAGAAAGRATGAAASWAKMPPDIAASRAQAKQARYKSAEGCLKIILSSIVSVCRYWMVGRREWPVVA